MTLKSDMCTRESIERLKGRDVRPGTYVTGSHFLAAEAVVPDAEGGGPTA